MPGGTDQKGHSGHRVCTCKGLEPCHSQAGARTAPEWAVTLQASRGQVWTRERPRVTEAQRETETLRGGLEMTARQGGVVAGLCRTTRSLPNREGRACQLEGGGIQRPCGWSSRRKEDPRGRIRRCQVSPDLRSRWPLKGKPHRRMISRSSASLARPGASSDSCRLQPLSPLLPGAQALSISVHDDMRWGAPLSACGSGTSGQACASLQLRFPIWKTGTRGAAFVALCVRLRTGRHPTNQVTKEEKW